MTTCGLQTVAIDVVPFDAQNNVDPENDVEVSVAVLATNLASGDVRDFDPAQIDPASLKFGPLETGPVSATPVVADVDGDFDDDFIYSFNVVQSGIACEDTSVSLLADVVTGGSVRGTDTITTPDCVASVCHP